MTTAAIIKSQTPCPVAPYLIATSSYYNTDWLGAVIAEKAFLEKVCMTFLEMIVIRRFDFTSFASCPPTVLVVWILYSQIPRIDFWMSATRTEAVILGWDAP
jgi:hypothetical protein